MYCAQKCVLRYGTELGVPYSQGICCCLQKTCYRYVDCCVTFELTIVFILFILILQYITRQRNNNRVNVSCYMFRLRRVIIRLII